MTRLASWWAAAKRRRPGIYLYITRRHLQPWRREFGYGGKSLHLPSRDKDHAGTGRWGQAQKPWYDLVVRRRVLELPWWLGWDWVISALESLMIWTLRPRYNDKLNPRRSKVRKYQQIAQRAERDAQSPALAAKRKASLAGYVAVRLVGALLIAGGLAGWWFTR